MLYNEIDGMPSAEALLSGVRTGAEARAETSRRADRGCSQGEAYGRTLKLRVKAQGSDFLPPLCGGKINSERGTGLQ